MAEPDGDVLLAGLLVGEHDEGVAIVDRLLRLRADPVEAQLQSRDVLRHRVDRVDHLCLQRAAQLDNRTNDSMSHSR